MKHSDLYNLSLNRIRIFLYAAESSSFNAAAKKLNYSQSMVSKAIGELEKSLGLILFVRDSSNTVLTPAGKSFYANCKRIITELEEAVDQAHSVQTGLSSTLRIGCVDSGKESKKFKEGLLAFHQKYPAVSVEYETFMLSALSDMTKPEYMDILLCPRHNVQRIERAGYTYRQFTDSTLAIYVGQDNPLYHRESLSFADLKNEKFIVLSPVNNPDYLELLTEKCAEYGYTPRISTYVSNVHSFYLNLILGKGILFADTALDIPEDGIKCFPLEGETAGIVIAWPRNSTNPNISRLLNLLNFPEM